MKIESLNEITLSAMSEPAKKVPIWDIFWDVMGWLFMGWLFLPYELLSESLWFFPVALPFLIWTLIATKTIELPWR